VTNALSVYADPDNFTSLTISLLTGGTGQFPGVVVNGQSIFTTPGGGGVGGMDFGTATAYPFMFFAASATGTATTYVGNLVQQTRYSDDLNPGTAAFKSGAIGTAAHTLQPSTDPGPTFLELWSRVATREGWYWRYTPTPFVAGSRLLGTVDLTTDPGTDSGTTQTIVFSRNAGNLVSIQLSANADQFASGTTASGVSGTGGGGVAVSRDTNTMTKYGVIDDQTLAVTAPTFSEQRRGASQIMSNKVNLSAAGSKSALVLRDPQTADKWRELDKVMIHDPEMGINYQLVRILGYTFDEGAATQSLILDQYGAEFHAITTSHGLHNHPVVFPPIKRLQQAIFQIANKFANR